MANFFYYAATHIRIYCVYSCLFFALTLLGTLVSDGTPDDRRGLIFGFVALGVVCTAVAAAVFLIGVAADGAMSVHLLLNR